MPPYPKTRAAVVDIGSNSIHLLVADRTETPGGCRVQRVISPATLLGLGRTVAAGGNIDDRAAAALTRVVARQIKQAERVGAGDVHVVATAAVRQAANGRQRMAALSAAVERPIRILTENREAELAFVGLVSELDRSAEQVIIDGGGASTEVIMAHGRHRVGAACLPIGGSLLSVRYGDPPTADQLEHLRRHVESLFGALPAGRPAAALATGGSARKLPMIVGGRSGDPIDQALLQRALNALQAVPAALLARGTGLQLRRVQTLAAGAIILGSLLRHYGLDGCRNSPHGIREGILVAAAEDPDHWWVDVAELQARREQLDRGRAATAAA
jgi:exopolyphosphatase/guanosine-5'-triphosphate,3'-diphosphate pyrophosphatase